MAKRIPSIMRRPKRPAPSERRSAGAGAAWGGAATGLSGFLPTPVLSGVTVTPDTALTYTAVFACINVLATDASSVPLEVKRRSGRGRETIVDDDRYDLVYCEPNTDTTAMRFFQAFYGHRLGWGNGFAEIDRIKGGPKAGMPGALWLLSPRPSDTYPVKTRDGRLFYKADGGRREVLAENVLHHAGLGWDGLTGYSPIALARQAVGLGIAEEQHGASFFGNSCAPNGVLKVKRPLSLEAHRNIRESMEGVHQGTANANRLMILEEDMDLAPYSINPADSQFLESRKFQVIEICRIFRTPPHKIGDYSQAHLANLEQSNIDYRNTALGPEIMALIQEANRKLFTREERTAGLHLSADFTSLMMGDSAARVAYYRERFATGSLSPDEIREREGDNPIEGTVGDAYYIPLNLAKLTTEDAAAGSSDPADGQDLAAAAADPSVEVQALALNGAQITSLIEVITQIQAGVIPKSSAKALLAAAFPAIPSSQIDAIVDPIVISETDDQVEPETPAETQAETQDGTTEAEAEADEDEDEEATE